MMHEWLQRSNVVLKGGGLDESPHCYKRLDEVLAAQGKPSSSCIRSRRSA
jgi:tRNA-splicing ligase RtcB